MIPIDARPLLPLALIALIILSGCSKLPTLRFNSPFGRSDWIELQDAQVLAKPDPAFIVTIVSQKDRPLWVRFLLDEIEGANDCADLFRLDPESRYTYRCDQAVLRSGAEYRAELTVFKDSGNTEVAERLRRIVTLESDEQGGFTLVGRPAN